MGDPLLVTHQPTTSGTSIAARRRSIRPVTQLAWCCPWLRNLYRGARAHDGAGTFFHTQKTFHRPPAVGFRASRQTAKEACDFRLPSFPCSPLSVALFRSYRVMTWLMVVESGIAPLQYSGRTSHCHPLREITKDEQAALRYFRRHKVA